MAKPTAPPSHLELTSPPLCAREAHAVHELRADRYLLSWKQHKDDVVGSARLRKPEQKAMDHMCYNHSLKCCQPCQQRGQWPICKVHLELHVVA